MREKFKNKYRIPSARLINWDYSNPGAYFITICTRDRAFYFGNIENGKMALSPIGAIADVVWHTIPYHSKNVQLGAFVVMPNHIHGILILPPASPSVQTLPATSPPNKPNPQSSHSQDYPRQNVQTLPATSPPNKPNPQSSHSQDYPRQNVQTLPATSPPNKPNPQSSHSQDYPRQNVQTLPATSPPNKSNPQSSHSQDYPRQNVQTLPATSPPNPALKNHPEPGYEHFDQSPFFNGQETLQATSLRDFYGMDDGPLQESPTPKNGLMAGISPTAGSVSTIIRSYKSAVSRHAHRMGFDFEWQTRFYDNIIRDERAFNNITNYIINNPSKWQDDKFHVTK